jgi:hypothetical protein
MAYNLESFAGFLEKNGYHVNGINKYRDNGYLVKLSLKSKDKHLNLYETVQFLEASGFTVEGAEEQYYDRQYPVILSATVIEATAC